MNRDETKALVKFMETWVLRPRLLPFDPKKRDEQRYLAYIEDLTRAYWEALEDLNVAEALAAAEELVKEQEREYPPNASEIYSRARRMIRRKDPIGRQVEDLRAAVRGVKMTETEVDAYVKALASLDDPRAVERVIQEMIVPRSGREALTFMPSVPELVARVVEWIGEQGSKPESFEQMIRRVRSPEQMERTMESVRKKPWYRGLRNESDSSQAS